MTDTATTALFLTHTLATWFLVGLCWIVQRVQYPLMSEVGPTSFTRYERGHVDRITPVVAPMMIIELLSGAALVIRGSETAWSPPFLLSMALLKVIWLSTFLIQVPIHRGLSERFDADRHRWLVRSNWIRTGAWTARGLILLWLLWSSMEGVRW